MEKLSAIDGLYRCSSEIYAEKSFDDLLTNLAFDEIQTVLTSRFMQLQNQALQRSVDNAATWNTSAAFVQTILDVLVSTEADSRALIEMKSRLLRLGRQLRSLNLAPRRKKPMALRSLNKTHLRIKREKSSNSHN